VILLISAANDLDTIARAAGADDDITRPFLLKNFTQNHYERHFA
jgi:hypothetical protein